MKNLDEIDLKIIELLRANGRTSLKDLSGEVFLTTPARGGENRKAGKRRLYRRDPRKTEYGASGIWNKGFYTGQRSSRKESEIL